MTDRSDRELIAEALAKWDGYHAHPAQIAQAYKGATDAVLAALAAAGRKIVNDWDAQMVQKLATSGYHIVGDSETVIDGQRGRLVYFGDDGWEPDDDLRFVYAFVPHGDGDAS